jgi:hypothetical protein
VIHTYHRSGTFITGHFVTVAGINIETEEIAYSDPYRDMEEYYSPFDHNDAAKISHDIYNVNNASPSFEIVNHAGWSTFTTLVDAAVIIIPPENGLPIQPEKPIKPQGPTSGKKDEEYTFITSTTHPLNKQLYYQFDWGDGTTSEWIGPYDSGEECETIHSWDSRGNYNIKVKAKDINEIESPWSDSLPILIAKYKEIPFEILNRIFQRIKINLSILEIFSKEVIK